MTTTRLRFSLISIIVFLSLGCCAAFAAVGPERDGSSHNYHLQQMNKPTSGVPCHELRVHKVGNIHITISNYGTYGTAFDAVNDPETGQLAPSCEFPAGSGANYLYMGSIWVGAIVGLDTLVSVGYDGGQWLFELHPTTCENGGGIVKRSSRYNDPAYDTNAVSEADYISVFTDTLADQAYVAFSPDDQRPHKPLGIEVVQKTYSWSYSYAEDFIIVDLLIRNIGDEKLKKAYIGVFLDPDVHHVTNSSGYDDDICGFRKTNPSPAGCYDFPLEDTIMVAWVADQDGDPNGSDIFGEESAVGVFGTRVIRSPRSDTRYSFNWWTWLFGGGGWGPVRAENKRDAGTGSVGRPSSDPGKYYMMWNGEFDYDQLWSAIDQTVFGWLPPHSGVGADLADGYDPRFLLSFGPYDIDVLDSLPITLAFMAGDHFHAEPNDFENYFDSYRPSQFYDKLDFTDLATNAMWAAKMYDNPGVDTDGDGYAGRKMFNPCVGETVWVSGDGAPDYAGPPPPPIPVLRFKASPGEVTISWNGYRTENTMDPFSFVNDFEGYRVYMANELELADFALITSYDMLNYNIYRLEPGFDPPLWELIDIPLSAEGLSEVYAVGDDLNDPVPGFTPEEYSTSRYPLYRYELEQGEVVETAYYFQPHGGNRHLMGGDGQIRRIYPDADSTEKVWVEELGEWVHAAWEYEIVVDGMMSSLPIYFAVTAFDFGYPPSDLKPLESSQLANAVEVYPTWSNEAVSEQNLGVSVFPNPYKLDESYGYLGRGFERLTEISPYPERARRIHFTNLPPKATIRIYSLDGDLVRELEHPCDCHLQEGESMMAWDLITRNTQAVVSGIYLWSVESEYGSQIGKILIIK